MPTANNISLTELLKRTSRSFYLTLRVLPAAVRPQIGLAYLLARTTDTVADTEIVPVAQRLAALEGLRRRILGQTTTRLDFGALAQQQGSAAEKTLLEQCEASLNLLNALSADDLLMTREVLSTIISGQELDLQRFAEASSQNIIALQATEELDDYTYRVAGCVGEFWTKMCRTHLFPRAKLDEAQLISDGVRFGKGLQLVNILRDIPADLRNGRCYLPLDLLREAGLTPADLTNPANEPRLRPLYNRWLDRAEAYLAAGWVYTNTLPRGQVRVCLACAWPILIGLRTIERLRTGNVLDPAQRIKITRSEVRRILIQTVLRYPFKASWQNLGPTPKGQRPGQ